MAKYRQRAIVIEAFCWDGSAKAMEEMQRICPGLYERSSFSHKASITFDTADGPVPYPVGTMIIKDGDGKIYGYSPEQFHERYEYVEG